MMEDTLRICHHFIDSFGTEFNNLFFYGDVGVGKTFLSTCIAKEIMNREYSVLYFSAPQLFNTLAKNAFDKNDIDAHNMCEYIFDCDLLIIDDLGTEYTNAFIASQFFTCINERLLHRKSTIISTNLSLESLADLYTERSFSRITSRYSLLKIVGDDIRIKKKLEH
jgi:DNA replication protein DnaC